jgi:hypothetical protein
MSNPNRNLINRGDTTAIDKIVDDFDGDWICRLRCGKCNEPTSVGRTACEKCGVKFTGYTSPDNNKREINNDV